MTQDYIPMKMAGSLRNGYARDRGRIIHAVPRNAAYDGPALCKETPGITWSDCEGQNITCPRCLKKIAAPPLL